MDSGLDPEVSAQLLRFVEQTTDFVGVSDPWGRVLYLNRAARKRLGVGGATDLTLADVFPPEAFTLYYDEVRPALVRSGAWSGEVPVNVADGTAVPMYVSASARVGPGGETNETVVWAHELRHLEPVAAVGESDVDRSTGVLSRSAFAADVRAALDAASRHGDTCALAIATVGSNGGGAESFEAVTAATVMRALAGRLTRLARSIDVVGHVGDHQLGLLLRGVRSQGEAVRIARAVHDALVDAPITTPGGEIAVVVGCGVALSKPGDDSIDLIERASATIWNEGAPRDQTIDAVIAVDVAPHASATMEEFRVGMSHGDVRAYAEPVVDLASDLVVGYRGLVRWHHRHLGALHASAFIDMIAETPLATQVDLYITRETAAVIAIASRDTSLHLYVPVSKRLVADVRTERYLSEIADAFSLGMHQIRLQLARPLLTNWSPALQHALDSLRETNIAFALTGVERVSDIQYLAERGFHELHLSRRLANAVATDANARHVVSEIVHHTHGMGGLVAATGVNRPEYRDALLETGCDLATGDLYGPPVPSSTIE